MTVFSVRVFDRAGLPVLAPADVDLQPARWTAAAVGGPASAEVTASGSVYGLLSLATWLGYRIEIMSDTGPVWWGEVDTVRVVAGGLERTATLEGMANRVKVLYSAAQAGGGEEAAETEWAEDTERVTAYGRRELVHSARGTLTTEQADALRARLLAAGRTPQTRLRLADGGKKEGTLLCRGHWARLAAVYYRQLAGLEEHAAARGQAWPLGLGFTSNYLAFVGVDDGADVHEVEGKLHSFGYDGLSVVFAGTNLHDGTWTVKSGDTRDPVAYAADTIHFALNDDMYDTAAGLAFIATGDVIRVAGAGQPENNGVRLVKTPGAGHIEVSPGWGSGFEDSGGTGPTVTVQRGGKLTLTWPVQNEPPNTSVQKTVTALGQRLYQTFGLASAAAWTLRSVEVRVRAVGSPADSLRVRLYTDAGGAPGALLDTATVAGSSLADEMEWVALTMPGTAQLNYGTVYGLLVDRTGAMDPDHYYEIELDPDGGYSRGALWMYDGTAYAPVTQDLIFRCLGAEDSAAQVQTVLADAGTGLSAVLVEQASGLLAWQYHGGEETAAAVVEGLLAQGTAGGARLLATVLSGLVVRVYPQEAAAQRLWVWKEGALLDRTGAPAPAGWLPAGAWVHLDDVLLTGAWAGLSPLFVERATYQVGRGWELDAEHQTGLADLLGVLQG